MSGWDGVGDFYEDDEDIEKIKAAWDESNDFVITRPPFTYWLKPKHWRPEAACWLAQHGWTKYCFVHDRIHWAWTHRGCCGKQRSAALSALRRAGFLR